MIKLSALFSALFLLVSCHDIRKEKQIGQLDQMIQSVDSVRTVFLANQIDSLGKMRTVVMDIEFRIRRNYISDTLDLELGKKVNEFKMVRKNVNPIGKMYNQLQKGTKEELEALKKLKKDIEEGVGERSKYEEYITFEKNKVKQLQTVLDEVLALQKQSLDSYKRLYPEMYAFSMSLIKTKK